MRRGTLARQARRERVLSTFTVYPRLAGDTDESYKGYVARKERERVSLMRSLGHHAQADIVEANFGKIVGRTR